MLPPPAPTSAMSTTGILSGKPEPARRPLALPVPPTWKSWEMSGTPSRTTPVLAVVPPMSKEITLPAPMSRPTAPAAMTPAAPPDSTV